MLRKSVQLILFFMLYASGVSAQRLRHGLGATFNVLIGSQNPGSVGAKPSLAQTLATYFPRFNLIEGQSTSLSIGFPLSGGVGYVSNISGEGGIVLSYDLPAVVDFNFGFKSTNAAGGKFGAYVGTGYGYQKVKLSNDYFNDFNGSSQGVIFRGGVRIGSENESWNGHGISIGLFYKKGREAAKITTVGANVLYEF